MANILTIAERELKSYFVSPIAYIITGLYAFFTGFIFYNAVVGSSQAQLTDTFGWMLVLALIVAPALTMRLFADENRQGTIEMLMTAPLRDWQIVIGKYIAGLIGYIALLIPTLWFVVILWRYGPPDYGMILAGYVGILLGGAAFVAVGMLTSSITGNQVVAFFLGFLVLLFLWFAGIPSGVTGAAGNPLTDFLTYISLPSNFQDFFSGVIDGARALYFVSLAAIAVFLTVRVVESKRWS